MKKFEVLFLQIVFKSFIATKKFMLLPCLLRLSLRLVNFAKHRHSASPPMAVKKSHSADLDSETIMSALWSITEVLLFCRRPCGPPSRSADDPPPDLNPLPVVLPPGPLIVALPGFTPMPISASLVALHLGSSVPPSAYGGTTFALH